MRGIIKEIVMSVVLVALSVGILTIIKTSDFSRITGYATVPVTAYVYGAFPAECNMTLTNGTNLISGHCFSITGTDLNTLFPDQSNIVAIYSYDSSSTDPWTTYTTHLPVYALSDLDSMKRGSAYYVLLNGTVDIDFERSFSEQATMDLITGWNLIGWPMNDTRLINVTLNETNYSEVQTYDNVNKSFLTFRPDGSVVEFTEFTTFQGYWVNSSENVSVVVTI